MKSTKKVFFLIFSLLFLVSCNSNSLINLQKQKSYIQTSSGFAIVNNNEATAIYLSDNDYEGVKKIAQKFQEDIERVTNIKPSVISNEIPSNGTAIIVGTIGNSNLIDQLIEEKKLEVSLIKGKSLPVKANFILGNLLKIIFLFLIIFFIAILFGQ